MTDILPRFEGVREHGSGWTARCPAHQDRRSSLSISRGDRQPWVLHCHTGCTVEAIVQAIGLTVADLSSEARTNGAGKTILATYDYTSEDGTLLYQVVRMAPKDFRQRRPDGSGGWIWKLGDVRRVPYRLPALRDRRRIFVVEGEKDADRLWALGLPATTSAGGAGKWRRDYADQFHAAGVAHVVTLPDHDPPGAAHGLDVARSCTAAGLTVQIINLPNLPAKGDVSDWLAAGHTADELTALADKAPLWEPDATGTRADDLPLTALGDLLAEPDDAHDWLVENRFACGSVNLLAGRPKGGKSTLARALALAVGRGDRWLGSRCQFGRVVYIALEDKRSEVRRHLRAMGATGDEPIRFLIGRAPKDLLARLAALIAAGDAIDLLIVDTAQRLLSVKDSNDYAVVTAAFEPVLALARTHNTCIVLLHHAGKADRAGIEAVMGSTAWAASVDNVLILNRRERYRLLSSIQRIGPDLDETVVTMDETTGDVRLGGSRYLVDLEHVADALLGLVRDAGPEGVAQIGALADVEARRELKLKALRRLLDTGAVTRAGRGNRYDPFILFCDAREPDAQPPKDAASHSSGSQVPSIEREPDEKNPTSNDSLREPHDSSGSRVPAVPVSGSHAKTDPMEAPADGKF